MDTLTPAERCRGRAPQAGFVFVEAVISIGLLVFALAGVHALLITSIRANSSAAEITSASALAQDKIEELRRSSFDTIASGSDQPQAYRRTWTVAAGPTDNTKRVSVTVGGASGSVQISTLLGK